MKISKEAYVGIVASACIVGLWLLWRLEAHSVARRIDRIENTLTNLVR